jgi:arylsulfatase A-like enzyme/Flp pilus assembly protein TadD
LIAATHSRTLFCLLAIAAAVLASTDCGGHRPPNVVLITIDTIRADHFGFEGYSTARTPNIDQFAASGAYFWRCTSPVPITLPSHTSILTGTNPLHHGTHDNGMYRVAPDNETLAEMLSARGYSTAAFVSGYPLIRRFGLDQGFDVYDDDLASDDLYSWTAAAQRGSVNQMAERPADATTRAAVNWLKGAREPFFVWIHYFDPHHSHQPPPPYNDIFFEHPYDGEIAFVDEQFGQFLRALGDRGLEDRTAVVVTGDHGEGLGDHGEDTHAMLTYDTTLRVPLIAHLPGTTAERQSIRDEVGVVDIVPTILNFLDFEIPEQVIGVSLLPLLHGGRIPDRALYFETEAGYNIFGWAKIHGVRSKGWKLIHSVQDELYHVDTDEAETRDLAGERLDIVARLGGQLDELVRQQAAPSSIRNASRMIPSDETRELLAALGYLSVSSPADDVRHGGAVEPGFEANRAHPRDHVWVINEWSRLREDVATGRFILAEERVGYLLAYDPSNPDFRNIQAMVFARTGRESQAREVWESLVADGIDRVNVLQNLGMLYLRSGRTSDALRLFEAGLPKSENDPSVYGWLLLNIAQVRSELNDPEGAVAALAELAIARPYDAEPLRRAAAIRYRQGRLDQAAELLERSVAVNPYNERSHQNLATVYLELGRVDQALEHARRSVEILPQYPEGRYILAVALIEGSRPDEARDILQGLIDASVPGVIGEQSRRLLAEINGKHDDR